MTRLIALYPHDWRTRYEAEFLSLMADRPPDPLDWLDIIRGAIDARLHPQVRPSSEQPPASAPEQRWSNRIGWLTLVGGLLWIATTLIALNGPIVVESGGTYRDGAAALPLYFGAVVLLCIGLGAAGASLPRRARIGRSASAIAVVGGLGWAFGPWLLMFGLILSVGLVVVGVSAWHSGRWSGADASLLVAGQLAAWATGWAIQVGVVSPRFLAGYVAETDVIYVVFVILTSAWLAVGHALVRGRQATFAARIGTR